MNTITSSRNTGKASPFQQLKETTTEHHQRAEAAVELDQALCSIESYRHCLEGFLEAWTPLERLLASAPQFLPPDQEHRFRAPLLHRDLTTLSDCSSFDQGVEERAVFPFTSGDLSRSRVLGVLYVLEGSTLGGQIVTRRLQKRLQISPENGGSFFYGHGPETGLFWKRFTQWATPQLVDPVDLQEAAEAAQATFEFVAQTFQQPAP